MKYLTILLIAMLYLASSCQKDNIEPKPDLPPATMTGGNTFGCYINGVPWVASKPPFTLFTDLTGSYSFQTNTLGIQANKIVQKDGEDLVNETMSIGLALQTTGLYNLRSHKYNFRDWVNIATCYSYSIDTLYPHPITITRFDTVNRVASGIFECRMINNQCADTLNITEGRFDMLFYY
ncbi:MAG: hypothetical protein K9I85_13080 [Saprospiraceae bacterium]|nr:hypothetical protein [Saprospiraceae bacterium]